MTDHLDTLDLAALTREAKALEYDRIAHPGSGEQWKDAVTREVVFSRRDPQVSWWRYHPQLPIGDEAAALRWLLRQPEAVARAACYERGVAAGLAASRDDHADAEAEYARGVAEERARHEATGAHECGALFPGPDGGRLVACTALVPGPRWCREHEVTRG